MSVLQQYSVRIHYEDGLVDVTPTTGFFLYIVNFTTNLELFLKLYTTVDTTSVEFDCAISNPILPEDLMIDIANNGSQYHRGLLTKNLNITAKVLDIMINRCMSPEGYPASNFLEILHYIEHPKVNPDTLAKVYSRARRVSLSSLRATFPTASYYLLARLLESIKISKIYYTLGSVAILPETCVRDISMRRSLMARMCVAANPNVPEDILRRFSKSVYKPLLLRVAENPRCPIDVAEKFLRSLDTDIREAIYNNAHMPDNIRFMGKMME